MLKQGISSTVVYETEFCKNPPNADLIFNMARDEKTVKFLQQQELKGVTVINPPSGIINCKRDNMVRIMTKASYPVPKTFIINHFTQELPPLSPNGKYWIKSSLSGINSEQEIVFCNNAEETTSTIDRFLKRNIAPVVVSEHISGDLIKFYGVDNVFFKYYYADDLGFSKFGFEKINGAHKGFVFNEKRFQEVCFNAAKSLNINIFGGDAVIAENGEFKIIDFNDWPSFAPCCNEAAQAIASLIISKI